MNLKRNKILKYSLIGGMVGLIVGILPWFGDIINASWMIYLWSPLFLITSKIFNLSGEENFIVMFLAPLFYLLLGLIIGLQIYKIKLNKR